MQLLHFQASDNLQFFLMILMDTFNLQQFTFIIQKIVKLSYKYYIKISNIFRGMNFSAIIAQQQRFRQKSRILEQRIVKNNNRIKNICNIFSSLKSTCSQIQVLINDNKNILNNLPTKSPKLNQEQISPSNSNQSQNFSPSSYKTQQIQDKVAVYSEAIEAKMIYLYNRGLYLKRKNRQLLPRMLYIKQNFKKFIDVQGSTICNIPLAQQYRNVNIKIVSAINLLGQKLSRLNYLEKYERNTDKILTYALKKQQVIKRLKCQNFTIQDEQSDVENVSEYEIDGLLHKSNGLSQKFILYINSIHHKEYEKNTIIQR